MDKKLVSHSSQRLSLFTFEGKLETVIDRLQTLRSPDPSVVETELVFDDDSWNDENCEYVLVHYRYETDKEYKTRLEKEERDRVKARERAEKKKMKNKVAKEKKELEERAEYERLRKKYGDSPMVEPTPKEIA